MFALWRKFFFKHHWLATLLTLTAVGVITGAGGGWYVLSEARTSLLQTLVEENEREAIRLARSIESSIRETGDPAGVLARIQASLSAGAVDETGFVCLLDSAARLISHPNPAMVGMDMAAAPAGTLRGGLDSTLAARLPGAPQASILQTGDFEGRPHFVLQVPIAGMDWVVSVHTDLTALDARLTALSGDLVLAGLPILLFFVLAGTIATRRVERVYESRLEAINRTLESAVDERTAELRRTLGELVEAKKRAESADRLKSEFLAVMGHEYRTPLNAVLGFSEILNDDPGLSEEHAEYVGEIRASGEHLLELIERILQFAAIESGGEHPEFEIVVLQEWLDETIERVLPPHREKGLTFSSAVVASIPPTLRMARNWTSRVLVELLDNAFKFTRRGKVSLYVSVVETGRQMLLEIRIHDTGCGFPEGEGDELGTLFTPGDGSISRRHEGIGLGLMMVRRIVERLEGELRVVPRRDAEGTEVICRVPVTEG